MKELHEIEAAVAELDGAHEALHGARLKNKDVAHGYGVASAEAFVCEHAYFEAQGARQALLWVLGLDELPRTFEAETARRMASYVGRTANGLRDGHDAVHQLRGSDAVLPVAQAPTGGQVA